MENELREAVMLGVELIVFSVLLLIVVLFGSYSRDAYNLKNNQDNSMSQIEEYRNIYEFSEGKNETKDNLVKDCGSDYFYTNIVKTKVDSLTCIGKETEEQSFTGNDVVRFVGLYPYKYNIRIIKGSDEMYLFKSLPEGFTKTTDNLIGFNIRMSNNKTIKGMDYNVAELSAWLGEKETSNFYGIFVYDENYGTFEDVIFILKE